MKTHLYLNASGFGHDTGPGHPERPERLQAMMDLFDEAPFSDLPRVPFNEAEYEWIARAHDRAYIDRLETLMPDRGRVLLDNDTVASPGSWIAALEAAGAVCQAVDDVLAGACDRAFCAVRPPGHHAGPNRFEGFCLFNNIMIGAMHGRALSDHTLRVAIVDFDVHHGNGSDAIVRRHPNGLFYASSHQSGIYPGTGDPADDIKGTIINVPLNAGDGSTAFRAAYTEHILPALDAFAPDLLMISAGFDAHKNDPLAALNLEDDDFAWVTEQLISIAESCCSGRIISVLEGGYDIDALKSAAAAHIRTLAGIR